jgi:hypothetical protein
MTMISPSDLAPFCGTCDQQTERENRSRGAGIYHCPRCDPSPEQYIATVKALAPIRVQYPGRRGRLDDGREGTLGTILAWCTEIHLDDGERLVVDRERMELLT